MEIVFGSEYQSMARPEIYNTIIGDMREFGIGTANVNSYRDAVRSLKDSMGVKFSPVNFEVKFGTYAIQATDFDMITTTQIEEVRKHIAKYKKLKCKFYVRIIASYQLMKREFAAFTEPNLVLWELDRINDQLAMQICSEVSAILRMPLKIVSK